MFNFFYRIVMKYHDTSAADYGAVRHEPEFKHIEYYCGYKN
jgi:hypothetical protein